MSNDGLGKVAILYGGCSTEREISLLSGMAVFDALRSLDVDAHLVDTADKKSVLDLNKNGFDRAFIALHGKGGEDGEIQSLLNFLEIPFTGSDVLPCVIAMDKVLTKKIWQSYQLPVKSDLRINNKKIDISFNDLKTQFAADAFAVKPIHDGSSIGISKVHNQLELTKALDIISSDEIMIEPWIEGRELTVAVIGSEVLPTIEIVNSNAHSFYDYEAKYIAKDISYICPAKIDGKLAASISLISKQAFNVIGASGWGRLDIMLDKDNKPWLLEINLSPGMTSHSLLPIAAKEIGISFENLVLKLLLQTVK